MRIDRWLRLHSVMLFAKLCHVPVQVHQSYF